MKDDAIHYTLRTTTKELEELYTTIRETLIDIPDLVGIAESSLAKAIEEHSLPVMVQTRLESASACLTKVENLCSDLYNRADP